MTGVELEVADSLERVYPVPVVSADWDDVLERADLPRTSEDVRRRTWVSPRSFKWRLLLLSGATVTTAAFALAVATPWENSPSVLDRAAAAIADPTSTQILEVQVSFDFGHFPSKAPAQPPSPAPPVPPKLPHVRYQGRGVHGTIHLWLEGAAPHRFRRTLVTWCPPPLVGTGVFCLHRPERSEVGGRLGGVTGLGYDSARDALFPTPIVEPEPKTRVSRGTFDPLPVIKAALTSGRAQLAGRATIRGHEVIRVRVYANRSRRGEPIALYYADAHSYQPVRITIVAAPTRGSLNGLNGLLVGLPPDVWVGPRWWLDFTTYRYLPPTEANRKLTDIRAQHPHAKII